MKAFDYYQPTDFRFGWGRAREIGEAMRSKEVTRCLMVTGPSKTLAPVFERIRDYLRSAGVSIVHYAGVVQNPTTDCVEEGTAMAEAENVDSVLGVGGGSSIDTAKAIAVGATHPGRAWDYRLFTENVITEKRLPIFSITTTSGTGSQVTPVSVVTNPDENSKFALVDKLLCPVISIIDPSLMVTLPRHYTASTGFDAFTHAFESYIHKNANPYTDLHAIDAIQRIVKYLPVAMEEPNNEEARTQMAWADTLAGLCIANAGTVLPHGIGMAIGGHAPHVLHGEALAVVYPEFFEYTYRAMPKKFAMVARILQPHLEDASDDEAAAAACEAIKDFLGSLDMFYSLDDLGVDEELIEAIADDSVALPDYTVNPVVPSRDEIYNILIMAKSR